MEDPLKSRVTLRPATSDDASLFYDLIFLTMREHIIATWGVWNEERVRVESIEDARSPNARVVMFDDEPVGVLTVESHDDHLQLEQLYLLPKYQQRGVGRALVEGLIAQAKRRRLPLRLRVLAVNPAQHFYEHLGFSTTSRTTDRVYMEYMP